LTILSRIVVDYGKEKILHVWDCGMANAKWLGPVLEKHWHFVVLWKKGNKLHPVDAPSLSDPQASETAKEKDGVVGWRLTMGKMPWGHRQITNPRNPQQVVNVHYGTVLVYLLKREEPLWLEWARFGKETRRRLVGSEP
jgi:hypothetical protein